MKVRELANIVFGARGRGIFMILKVYFDGSGKDTDSVLTVGGYVASDRDCGVIEREWLKATKGRVFRLADFGRRACQLGSYDWGPSKRAAFLDRLARIVTEGKAHIVSLSIEVEPYRSSLETDTSRLIFSTPFSGCAQAVLSIVETLADNAGVNYSDIAYVFEKGEREHEMHFSFDELQKEHPEYQERRSLSFLPKKTTLLQPADLIAGTIQRMLLRVRAKLGTLDNGHELTPLLQLQNDYLPDPIGRIIVHEAAAQSCCIANKSFFAGCNSDFQRVIRQHPYILDKREKPIRNQGRRKTRRLEQNAKTRKQNPHPHIDR